MSTIVSYMSDMRSALQRLKSLDAAERKIVGEDIKDVEFAWPIGMLLCRALGKGPWRRKEIT